MMIMELKIGDKIRVIKQENYMFPEIGEEGIIVSMNNEYPKVKFDNKQPLVESLEGLVVVDPLTIKKITL
jgi:hypothetical protein